MNYYEKKIKNTRTTPPYNHRAFTLAEVMVTLVIVGVVAAVTVPIMVHNIMDNAKTERVKNIKSKLSKATDAMLATSGMTGYSSTEDFVNAFKKHMRITQICKPEEIEKCWGSKSVTVNDEGKQYEISKATTPSQLKISSSLTGYKDIMGIVTADGAPMIISYNTDCDLTLSSGKVWKEYQSSSSNCIAGVFDWNGGKNPNKLGKDVFNFNASGGLGNNCAFEIGSSCYRAAQIAPAMSSATCKTQMSALGIAQCTQSTDYWAGAVAQCGGVNNVATKDDMKKIAEEIYGAEMTQNNSVGRNGGLKVSGTFNSEAALKYGISEGDFFWTAEEWIYDGVDAYTMGFYGSAAVYYNGMDSNGFKDYARTTSGGKVICKGE